MTGGKTKMYKNLRWQAPKVFVLVPNKIFQVDVGLQHVQLCSFLPQKADVYSSTF